MSLKALKKKMHVKIFFLFSSSLFSLLLPFKLNGQSFVFKNLHKYEPFFVHLFKMRADKKDL